jgi:hypothetical protein
MNHISRIHFMSFSRYALMIAALALAGCDREQIKVQEVPKDSEQQSAQTPTMSLASAANMPADPHAGMDMGQMGGGDAQPQLKWKLPSGWKEKAPSQMRVASFDAGKEGQTADVSIIPLQMPGGPKMELDNYNLWRQSLQLPPVDKVESQPVAIGSEQGKLYEVGDSKSSNQILAAVLEKGGLTWYFKMSGEDAVVKEQKPAFLDFLKSISFEAAPVTATAAANPHAEMSMGQPVSAEAMATAISNPSLPTGWKEIPNAPMLLAKYVIQGAGDAKAEVNVSQLNLTGGGVLANVTRWRGQLGLAPMAEEDFSKTAQTVDVAGNKGTLVDMTGTDSKTGKKSRLIGIIVPEMRDTWFYKLMGDPEVVEQQKDTFLKFLQTAKFGN